MNIEISIAVSPAVKKYIAYKHEVNPFIISRTNYFGIFLHNSLVRMKAQPTTPPKELNPDIYSEKLNLALSEDLWSRQGWYIHPKKQYDFNRLVEMVIDQDFNFYIDVKTGLLKEKMYLSFYDFREKFGLTEDDLALKTMEKRYQRYRKGLTG